ELPDDRERAQREGSKFSNDSDEASDSPWEDDNDDDDENSDAPPAREVDWGTALERDFPHARSTFTAAEGTHQQPEPPPQLPRPPQGSPPPPPRKDEKPSRGNGRGDFANFARNGYPHGEQERGRHTAEFVYQNADKTPHLLVRKFEWIDEDGKR